MSVDVTIDQAHGEVAPSRTPGVPPTPPPPSRASQERATRELLRREAQRAARVRAT